LELHSLMRAHADKYGIEFVHDLFERDVRTDPGIASQLRPMGKNPVYLVHKSGGRKPVLGNAVSKHASRLGQGFENDGMVPGPAKKTGAGKTGRSGADDCDLFLVELSRNFDRSSEPVLHFMVGNVALKSTDGDRFVHISPVAGGFAGMRAHTADGERKREAFPYFCKRLIIFAVSNESNVRADIQVRRAGRLANRHIFLEDVEIARIRVEEIDRRTEPDALVEVIIHIDRAHPYALAAAVAFFEVHPGGFAPDAKSVRSVFSGGFFHLSVCDDADVRVFFRRFAVRVRPYRVPVQKMCLRDAFGTQ